MDIESTVIGSVSAVGGLITLAVSYFTLKAMARRILRAAIRFIRDELREAADG